MKKIKKAALVCSGGGALGIAFLGIIQELSRRGYEFDFYAGTSVGAIITSMLACKYSEKEIFKFLDETKLFKLVFDFSPSNFGILKGNKIHDIFEKMFEDKKFEDLDIPLYVGATNFLNGERVILNNGYIKDAVRASISVPVLFEPFRHPDTGDWLVDGGLSQNLPLDIAIEKYEGDEIIALDLSGINENIDFTEKKFFKKNGNIPKTLGRTFKIFFKNQQTHFPKDPRVKYYNLTLPFESVDIFKFKEIYQWGIDYAKNIEI